MQKYLLVIEANTTGTGLLALSRAQWLGLSPLFITNNPRRYHNLEQIECPVLICDTNSVDTLMHTISAHMSRDQISGITTTSEFYLEIVAKLAAVYNLPGNPPQVMRSCRNKARTRVLLEAEHVKQPRFAIIRSATDITRALLHFDLPYVVKPTDDTGSHEVRLCETREEAEEQAVRILGVQKNVRGQQTSQTVLVEEFLSAPEFSVEMFTWQGITTCIGITEKSLTSRPYFVEHQHIFPASLSMDDAEDIQKVVRQALATVGVTHGATHTEVKLTPQGCAIIEINARLAGGMIPELIHYVTGIDLLEQQLKAAVGDSPNLPTSFSGYAGIRFLVSHLEGLLVGVRGIEEAWKCDSVKQVAFNAPISAPVTTPRSAYDRLGYIIVYAHTHEEVVYRLQEAAAKIELLVVS